MRVRDKKEANERGTNETRSFDALAREIRSVGGELKTLVARATTINKANALRARQAEWHVRGMTYHCMGLLRHYKKFAGGVAGRAAAVMDENGGTPPAMIFMYSPECQRIMFEFYALVNLARISLDRLVHVVAPVFKTPFENLPSSFSDFMGRSDCPLYQLIENHQPFVSYLVDVRDCLVHFRSFGTHDNASVQLEGHVEPDDIRQLTKEFFRAVFRRVGPRSVSVNVLLPDTIFIREGNNKRLATFTYDKRINILTQSREFLRMVHATTSAALALLIEPGRPTYTYQKGHPSGSDE